MKFTETEEKNWICTHFDKMMQAGSEDERNEYIFNNPLLLTLNAIPIITEERGQDPEVLNGINYLSDLRKHYWSQPEEYPSGFGPIEKILELFRNGTLSLDEAKQRAKDVDCAGLLSPLYVKALLLHLVNDLDIDINYTMQAAEVVVDAVISMPMQSFSIYVMMQSTEGYIRLAHGSLLRRPDGQVYKRALDLGQWAADVANASNNNPLKSEFLHMIGTLSLDAYAANFGPNEDYANNINVWIGRAVNPMPHPSAGLENARIFLNDAIPFRDPGSPRGLTAKALLEAIIYEAFYNGVQPDIEYLMQLSGEARKHLHPEMDRAHIDRVQQLMGIFL